MKLILRRTPHLAVDYVTREAGIIGVITSPSHSFEFYTLENQSTIIPAGTYKLVKYKSEKFGQLCYMLQDVPFRQYIAIHAGNTPRNSRGCILVGVPNYRDLENLQKNKYFCLLQSKKALSLLTTYNFTEIEICD